MVMFFVFTLVHGPFQFKEIGGLHSGLRPWAPTSGCPWPKATVKPRVWNLGPKVEILSLENHVLKVFWFRSWKPRVWKSRPQSWDLKSWKPCRENHILKFPRPQSWDPKSWKPNLKISQVFLPALPCPVCNCCPALALPVSQTDMWQNPKMSFTPPALRPTYLPNVRSVMSVD